MNRIEKKLSENKKLLSIYFTAGYPQINDTIPVLKELEQSGVDMVEIGLPFSDPLADGPTIQASSTQALHNGMTTSLLFEQLEGIRDTISIPLIIMGYFNDYPTSKSVKKYLVNDTFYNPMERLIATGNGTLNYKRTWHLFDQIIFSKNFISIEEDKHSFKYAEVFDKTFLKEWKGKYKGNPFRTYIGKWYQGGFSDHFPVYVYLKKN